MPHEPMPPEPIDGRRAGCGRAARGAYGRARPAAAADAASGGGAAPDDAEAADGGEAARPRNACGDERGAEVGQETKETTGKIFRA
jgi:hypothetical protein